MQISGLGSGSVSNNSFSGVQSFKFNPNDMREKMRAQTRETKLREQEDEMIKELQKQISQVNDSNIDQKTKDAQLKNLSAQIQNIYDNRTEREKQAREAELQKQKAEMEETKRKQEEASEKRKPAKPSGGDAIVTEDMEGMVKLAVSHDGLNALKKTKAGLASEAQQLTQEVERDAKFNSRRAAILEAEAQNVRGAELAAVGLKAYFDKEMVGSARNELLNEGSFKARHMEDLNNGIANLEAAVNTEIGEINKEVNDMTEAKNEAVNENGKGEKPEEVENVENAQRAETENASENAVEKENAAGKEKPRNE